MKNNDVSFEIWNCHEILNVLGIDETLICNKIDLDAISVTGITIDSRTINEGDLFLALQGANCHGNDFVISAIAAFASVVICSKIQYINFSEHSTTITSQILYSNNFVSIFYQNKTLIIIVSDAMQILEAMAKYRRQQLENYGTTVIGITGSVGKTTMKDLSAFSLRKSLINCAKFLNDTKFYDYDKSEVKKKTTELCAQFMIANDNSCEFSESHKYSDDLSESHKLIALYAENLISKSPASFNNDLGLFLSLVKTSREAGFCILELGVSAPGNMKSIATLARPDLAIITTIGPSHITNFDNIDAIATEKAQLFYHTKKHVLLYDNVQCCELMSSIATNAGLQVHYLNADCHYLVTEKESTVFSDDFYSDPRNAYTSAVAECIVLLNSAVIQCAAKLISKIHSKARSKNHHNTISNCGLTQYTIPSQNISAALKVCELLRISSKTADKRLQTFKGLQHRIEEVCTLWPKNAALCGDQNTCDYDKITVINDSKATNLHSTFCAFETYKNNDIIWIAGGGDRKEQDFSLLFTYMQNFFNSKTALFPKFILLFGESKYVMEEQIVKIEGLATKSHVQLFENLSEAIAFVTKFIDLSKYSYDKTHYAVEQTNADEFIENINLQDNLNRSLLNCKDNKLLSKMLLHNIFSNFQTPIGRGNIVEYQNFTLIDGSYNANPLSMSHGLKHVQNIYDSIACNLRGQKILVIGDMAELGNSTNNYHLSILENAIATADVLILFGDNLLTALKSHIKLFSLDKKIIHCRDINEIIANLQKYLTNKKDNLKDVIFVKGSGIMQLNRVVLFLQNLCEKIKK
jgi:UDP-N-acetylmuramyl pentapeptide synthase